MLGTEKGREAILEYMSDKKLTYHGMGTLFGYSGEYVRKVLKGEAKGEKATQLIISIISEFKI